MTAPSSPANSTDSSLPLPEVAAPSALCALKHDAPWRRVAERYLGSGSKAHPRAPKTWGELYRLLGWNKSTAYTRRRFFHLQVRVAAQMSEALRAPLGMFLAELAQEEGIPPLSLRVIQKPKAFADDSRRKKRTASPTSSPPPPNPEPRSEP